MSRWLAVLVTTSLIVAAASCGGGGGGGGGGPKPAPRAAPTPMPTATVMPTPTPAEFVTTLLANAPPDECFVGLGSSRNQYPGGPTCMVGVPKVNQAYVWGLTETGTDAAGDRVTSPAGGVTGERKLWFGSAANVLCLVMGGLFTQAGLPLTPFQDGRLACEFGSSNYRATNPSLNIPASLGDTRPPQIYNYDVHTKTLTNITPTSMQDPSNLDPLTLGLRSAGSLSGVVILAGPTIASLPSPDAGINMFAYNSTTGQFIGAQHYSQYIDIRSWLAVGSVLYAGVMNSDGTGSVLRWTGNTSNPFQFENVGNLDLSAAYLVAHKGRIFATTWPGTFSGIPTTTPAGLWMSPAIPTGGLTPANVAQWSKVWSATNYEPDPLTALSWPGGALSSYDGQLYWGLMQVPMTAALTHLVTYGIPLTPANIALAILGTERAIPIFRCCTNLSHPHAELLYGARKMPVQSPTSPHGWSIQPNAMGVAPEYGPAGFGNPFNTYTWSGHSFFGYLFFGTFDWSFDALPDADFTAFGLDRLENGGSTFGGLPNFLTAADIAEDELLDPAGDIWMFASGTTPAAPFTRNGLAIR